MFVDYNYYTDDFKGTMLTKEEFSKYGNSACIYITANTLSRITDSGILNYPVEIQNNCKNCACDLAEFIKQSSDFINKLGGVFSSDTSEGLVKSKTAGAVSVTYDTSASNEYFLNHKNQENIKQNILKMYLSPVCINGTWYNLFSKVLR